MLSTVLAEAKAYFCSFCVYSLRVMVLSCEDLLEKWFPLRGERAHSLKLFCMYDKRFEISRTK